MSVDTRPRYRPSVGRDVADSVGRVSVECRSSIGRHIDRHTPPTYSTDILADTWARDRPTLGRASVDMLFKLVDRQSPLSVHTWSVCRSTLDRHLDRYVTISCLRHIGRLSVVYGSTCDGILCIVNRLFCWNILKCQPSPARNPRGTQKNSMYRLHPYGDRANTSDNCSNDRHF